MGPRSVKERREKNGKQEKFAKIFDSAPKILAGGDPPTLKRPSSNGLRERLAAGLIEKNPYEIATIFSRAIVCGVISQKARAVDFLTARW